MQEVFDKYINYLKVEKNVSPYTLRNYVNDLLGNYARGEGKGFIQFLINEKKIKSLKDVDKNTIRDYLLFLQLKRVARASIARRLSSIRSFYHYLRREEIVATDPTASISSPKLDKRLPSFLTPVEASNLIEATELKTALEKRDRALLEMLYACGLRVSELTRLNLEHVNLNTNEVRAWGKGSKERMVLMGEPAAKALNRYLKTGRPQLLTNKTNRALFLNRYGERLTARSVQTIVSIYADKIGLTKNVHPHLLRHTFATHMLDGGADLRVVQELLGHANLATTEIYTHVSQAQARKVYLSAHPMVKKEDQA